MVYINSTAAKHAASRASLTGALALSLADNAFKAGRIDSAVRYLEIAYAIFDAEAITPVQTSALPNSG